MKIHKGIWVALLLVIIVMASFLAYFGSQSKNSLTKIENHWKQTMGLGSFVGKQVPNVTLIDQTGKRFRLSDFQGKVIVLTFIDPANPNNSNILASEFRGANQQLGKSASDIEFLAVTVNPAQSSPSQLRSYSVRNRLSRLTNWHFLTGSRSSLATIWNTYGVSVNTKGSGQVMYTNSVIFIDENGRSQYRAVPTSNPTTVNDWSSGIAFCANGLT